jgi:hypothetical protein
MTARPVGRCRVETVHPTRVLSAEDGVLGTAVHRITQSEGESVNCIEDISSQSLRQIPSGPHLPPPLASPPPDCVRSAASPAWSRIGPSRSSVQIRYASGGASEGGYWVPQAVQMKAVMSGRIHSPSLAGISHAGPRTPPPVQAEGGHGLISTPDIQTSKTRPDIRLALSGLPDLCFRQRWGCHESEPPRHGHKRLKVLYFRLRSPGCFRT